MDRVERRLCVLACVNNCRLLCTCPDNPEYACECKDLDRNEEFLDCLCECLEGCT